MQKSRKKKGFTLTELAIVIAVIAILIAVLVPTFVSLINSAKLSADEQATRNMNTALATSEATDGKPSNLVEAKKVLAEAGYKEDLEPTTSGYYYYWNSEYNIVMLIDTSGDEWELIYPSTDDANNAYTMYSSTCYNLNAKGTTEKQDKILALVDAGGTVSVGSTSDYDINEIVTLANTYGETFAGATIQLTGDVTYSSKDPISNFQGIFDGAKANDEGNYTITVSGITPVYGDDGNGYLYSNVFDKDDGRQQYKYSYGLFGSVTKGGIVKNITVSYSDTNPTDPENEYTYFGGIAGCLDGGTISNCTVSGTIIQYNRVGGIAGNVLDGTIENCNVTANITSCTVGKTTYVDSDKNAVHDHLEYYSYAAGIIAYAGNKDTNNGSITIMDCKVYGTSDNKITLSAECVVGGVVGWVAAGVDEVNITNTSVSYVTLNSTATSSVTRLGAVYGTIAEDTVISGSVDLVGISVTSGTYTNSSGTTLNYFYYLKDSSVYLDTTATGNDANKLIVTTSSIYSSNENYKYYIPVIGYATKVISNSELSSNITLTVTYSAS